MPPTILHVPSVRDTYINEPETFSVSFLSSCEANTTVKWLLDNEHLSNNGVVITSYVDGNNTFGTTTLEFSELTRADRGRYSVTIINNIPLIPENLMMASINFRVDVYGKGLLALNGYQLLTLLNDFQWPLPSLISFSLLRASVMTLVQGSCGI